MSTGSACEWRPVVAGLVPARRASRGGTSRSDVRGHKGRDYILFWAGFPELRREWAEPGKLFLVINRSDLDSFDPPLDPPPVFLAAKNKKLLVVNR